MSKPPKTWIITDTHFHHLAMMEYCGRPFDHTEIILKNWRNAVRDQDCTIHLGDVIIGQDAKLTEMLGSIKGKKFLIIGNHDKKSKHWYMSHGFDFVGDGLAWDTVYLSHKPVEHLPDDCTINLHGHFHNADHHRYDTPTYPHSRLFAIENNDLKPVLLTDLLHDKLSKANKA